jgi:hypothetical protein
LHLQTKQSGTVASQQVGKAQSSYHHQNAGPLINLPQPAPLIKVIIPNTRIFVLLCATDRSCCSSEVLHIFTQQKPLYFVRPASSSNFCTNMDGFPNTLFDTADNAAYQTQPFFFGGGGNTTSSQNILKVNCKPITKITITFISNNSMNKISCYLMLKNVYLVITALVKSNFVSFET